MEEIIFPLVKLGILEGNKLTCEDGEVFTVYPYGPILDEFEGVFSYFLIVDDFIIINAVKYKSK